MTENQKLAKRLFEARSGNCIDTLAQQKYPSQHETIMKVIELCGKPVDGESTDLLSAAYSWAGAAYRQLTIKWTQKAIDMHDYYNTIEMPRRLFYVGSVFSRLGQAQEGEHLFIDAIASYQAAYQIDPCFCYAAHSSNAFVKLGYFDEAINVLIREKANIRNEYIRRFPLFDEFKNCKEYVDQYNLDLETNEKDMLAHIDSLVERIWCKKNKGYVYKPRRTSPQITTEVFT